MRLLLTLFFLFLSSASSAAKPTPEEIADKAFGQAFVGLQKGTASISMLLEGKGRRDEGQTQILTFKSMRNDEGLLRYLVRFEKPLTKKGMSFLVREKKDALPDTWLFVGGQLTQMAAGKATGTFFGSDLIFADLLPYPKEKNQDVSLQSLPNQIVGGNDCYVVQITIKNTESPYGRILAFVRKAEMIPAKVEFYGQDGTLFKILVIAQVEKINGRLIPTRLEISKHGTDRKTTLIISEIKPDSEPKESEFEPSKLK